MTATERNTLARLTLALENIEAQLAALAEAGKPVPAGNVQGAAYLLGMAVERLGIVSGTVITDDPPTA